MNHSPTHCEICPARKVRIIYSDGKLESPYQLRRRMTCGDPVCMKALRGRPRRSKNERENLIRDAKHWGIDTYATFIGVRSA